MRMQPADLAQERQPLAERARRRTSRVTPSTVNTIPNPRT